MRRVVQFSHCFRVVQLHPLPWFPLWSGLKITYMYYAFAFVIFFAIKLAIMGPPMAAQIWLNFALFHAQTPNNHLFLDCKKFMYGKPYLSILHILVIRTMEPTTEPF